MSGKRYNWEEIQKLYDEGNSYHDLMKLIGISESALIKASRRGDLVTRKGSDAIKLAFEKNPKTSSRNKFKYENWNCPKCKILFPISEFKTRGYCRLCHNELQRFYRKTIKGKTTHDKGCQAYRARKFGLVEHHTNEEWLKLLNFYNYECVKCGDSKNITKDHIMPLSKGGSDRIDNIQPLCRSCNSSKNNKIDAQSLVELIEHMDIYTGEIIREKKLNNY